MLIAVGRRVTVGIECGRGMEASKGIPTRATELVQCNDELWNWENKKIIARVAMVVARSRHFGVLKSAVRRYGDQ